MSKLLLFAVLLCIGCTGGATKPDAKNPLCIGEPTQTRPKETKPLPTMEMTEIGNQDKPRETKPILTDIGGQMPPRTGPMLDDDFTGSSLTPEKSFKGGGDELRSLRL
ncbi:MAG: hypothetical protein EOP50_08860 [Sphingobacteriales bacterium]|nr:MAG: hypothetical protein EOP50_08860 [Sphingobacteriales bacterium]